MGKRPLGLSKANASKKAKTEAAELAESSTSSAPEGFATVAVPARAGAQTNGKDAANGSDEAADDALTLEDLASLKDQSQALIEQLYLGSIVPETLLDGIEGEVAALEDKLAGLLRGICHEAHRRMTLEEVGTDDAEASTLPFTSTERRLVREYLAWAAVELGILLTWRAFEPVEAARSHVLKEGEPTTLKDWLAIASAALEESGGIAEGTGIKPSTPAVEAVGAVIGFWDGILRMTEGPEASKQAQTLDVISHDLFKMDPRTAAALIFRAVPGFEAHLMPEQNVHHSYCKWAERNLAALGKMWPPPNRGDSQEISAPSQSFESRLTSYVPWCIVYLRGTVRLSNGAALADIVCNEFFGGDDEEGEGEGAEGDEWPEDIEKIDGLVNGRRMLSDAIIDLDLCLSEASHFRQRADKANDDSVSVAAPNHSPEELKSKLGEALVNLANLTPPGEERDALYERAEKEAGITLD